MLQQVHVNELVSNLVQMEGSNLHLEVGAPPAIRVHSSPQYMEGYEFLRPVDIEHMLASIIPQKLVKEIEEDGKATFTTPCKARAASESMRSDGGARSPH